jgi:DNA-binding CsgD family transcriptional regulator/tetratricopeptide (TPR) repeat protein
VALALEAEAMADSLARAGAWSEAAGWLEAAVPVSATQRAAERRRWSAALFRCYGGAEQALPVDARLDPRTEHPLELLLAGMVAVADACYGDAEVSLRRAWELIDPAVEPDTACRVALRLSDCLQGQLRSEEALLWARRAVEVLPGAELLGEDPLTDLAFALLTAGQVPEAVALVAESVPADAAAGTPGLLARGLVGLFTDQLLAAMEDLSEVADRYLRVGPPHKYVQAQSLLAEVNYRIGLWEFSARHAQEAIAAARERAIPQLTALPLAISAGLAAAQGDWPAAEGALNEAAAALALRGSYQALGWTWIARARLEAARANPQGVIDALSTVAALSDAFSVVDDEVLAPWRSLYGPALVRLGRIDEAADHADRLTKFANARRAPSALGAAARLRGVLAGARGDPETASAELAEAIGLLEAIPMPFEAALAQLDLGCELRRAGRRRDAASHLEAARAVFARLDATPFVGRCNAELASCGLHHQQGPSHGPIESLTPAEAAVAELVAAGASNREVADRLSVSVRTVEHHLRRTYTKLGVGSRSQLAALLGKSSGKDP